MEDRQKEIFLSVKDDYLANKKVDYVGYAATKFVGFGEGGKQNPQRIFQKAEFIDFLRNDIGMKKTKAYDCFKALEDINLIKKQENGKYSVDKETAPFLKLYKDTVRYFFDHYKPIHFKVYCYLLNKYNIHQTYRHKENYFFSCAELLRAVGYNDRKFNNTKLMNEVLIDLENNHFISYNHETVGKPGKHGRYKELYWVNYIAENSKLAFGETIKQDNQLPQWFNGQDWNSYHIIDFEDSSIMNLLLKYPANISTIKYALEQGDILPQYEKACENFVGKSGRKSR